MKPPYFQKHKVEQALKTNGVAYTFSRPVKDQYGEPTAQTTEVILNGIFHEQGTGFILVNAESATVSSKPTPMILALLSEAQALQQEDTVQIPPDSGRAYKVVNINDIGNLGYFASVSLEVIINGVSV